MFWRREQESNIDRLVAASANREKLEKFVIGKSKKPQYIKDVKQLLCRYRVQKKSWMTGVLFEETGRKT